MKNHNMLTAILYLVLAGLWIYLGVTKQDVYLFLAPLAVLVSIVYFLRHFKEKRK